VFDNREAKASSTHLSRTRPVNPVKAFEDACQVFRRNSFSLVRHRDPIQLTRMMLDPYSAARVVELQAVVDEISEHLFQPAMVGKYFYLGVDLVSD
jgi:hypothetical protein